MRCTRIVSCLGLLRVRRRGVKSEEDGGSRGREEGDSGDGGRSEGDQRVFDLSFVLRDDTCAGMTYAFCG